MSGPRHIQRRVGWNEARDIIVEALHLLGTESHTRVIGVTGPVGSGKSTLAARLGGVVIPTDSYLPDYDEVPYALRDRPEHSDLARLGADLGALRRGENAEVPVWSYQTHRREGYRRVAPGPLVIVEGIHALHELARPHLDLRVFVDAPASVRWARWEVLETSGARGWGVEVARRYFDDVAEPTFRDRTAEYLARADLVIINDRGVPDGRAG